MPKTSSEPSASRKRITLQHGDEVFIDFEKAVKLEHGDRLVLEDGRLIAMPDPSWVVLSA